MRLLVIACYVCLTLYSVLSSARERRLNSSHSAAFPANVTNVGEHSRSKRVVETNGLTDDLRKQFLDLHNQYRTLRNASNMMMMVYDNNIEMMAQEWTDRCKWEHSTSAIRQNKAGFGNLGENMAATTGPFSVAATMSGWHDEVVDYSYATTGCTQGKMCGHYTQVVWHSSKAVGCGIRFCKPLQGAPWDGGHFTVCRYGPGGNVVFEKPYRIGAPCSECPADAKFCINNLCSSTADPGTMTPGGGGTPMPGGGTPMPPSGTAAIQPRTSWIGLMLMIVVHLIVIGTI